MTPHEQKCFNDQCHKAKVAVTVLRLISVLQAKLAKTNTDDQMPLLFKIEELLR
jgi:hypothetical protein